MTVVPQIFEVEVPGAPVELEVAPTGIPVIFAAAPGPRGEDNTGFPGPTGPSGITGPAGPTGTAGPTGPAGPAGVTGPAGSVGASGAKGDTGVAGPSGAVGSTGAIGPVGPAGTQGSSGPTGQTGATGSVGPSGTVGATGPSGPKGDTGSTGVAGPAGSVGATGPAGVQGATGLAGPTGASGPSGPAGAKGDTGSQGAAGPTGLAGPVGSTGATGPQGPIGLTGTSGATGLQGPIGTPGASGPTGPTGSTGPAGVAGNTGETGADSTIPGPTGPQGVKGDTGSTGATGAQGVIGPSGAKGDTGDTGPIGATGLGLEPHLFSGSASVSRNLAVGYGPQFFGYLTDTAPWAEGQYVTFTDQTAGSNLSYYGRLFIQFAGGFGWALNLAEVLSVTGSTHGDTSSNWLMSFAAAPQGATGASSTVAGPTGPVGPTGPAGSLSYTAEDVAAKGVANGYAALDSNALVPASQLPSYVDDVVEYASAGVFPISGDLGKIYIAADTSRSWRWTGSVYAEIIASPGTTDAISEGSTNLFFTNTRADARVSSAVGVSVQAYASALTTWAGKTAPTGTVVGTTDTQTITNKTVSGSSNTLSNIGVGSISATGTASSSTYLRGDGAWAATPGINTGKAIAMAMIFGG